MLGTDSFCCDEPHAFLLVAIDSLSVIDGDTLRVEVMAPQHWENSLGPARKSQTGEISIRLLGLDAPETYFPTSPPHLRHQPPQHGQFATACLNQALKVSASLDDGEMRIFTSHSRPTLPPHNRLGYLLVNHQGLDRYGRLLAFIWLIDDHAEIEHLAGLLQSSTFQSPLYPLQASVNYFLLAEGAAYPDFHSSMGYQSITVLRGAVHQAQLHSKGIWREDQTRSGIHLVDASSLAMKALILPRLYRRIAAFFKDYHPEASQEEILRMGLREFLMQIDQPVHIHSSATPTLFSELLSWEAPRLGLHAALEDLEW